MEPDDPMDGPVFLYGWSAEIRIKRIDRQEGMQYI